MVIGLRTGGSLASPLQVTVLMGRSVVGGNVVATGSGRQALIPGSMTQLGGTCLGFYLVRSFDEHKFDGARLEALVQHTRNMLGQSQGLEQSQGRSGSV
jgi:hypothetical protein